MLSKFLFNYSAKLPCRIINRNDSPYLERYYLGTWLNHTFYLHRFIATDESEELHDHPWSAYSLILTGRYTEERLLHLCTLYGPALILRRFRAGCINRLKSCTAHRILYVQPETWTLFVHPALEYKGWGFYRTEAHPLRPHVYTYTTTYHQPLPLMRGHPWWLTAPVGALAPRMPYTDATPLEDSIHDTGSNRN